MPDRQQQIVDRLTGYFQKQTTDIEKTKQKIIDWCKSASDHFPTNQVEYKNCQIDGQDILDEEQDIVGIRPNFRIQRCLLGGSFIVGYSNEQIVQEKSGKSQILDKMFYLNPSLEMAPIVAEEILQIANQEKLPLKMKVWQRTAELAEMNRNKKVKNIKADGINIYINGEHVEALFEKILSVQEKHNLAFKGRVTAKLGHKLADGVAFAERPTWVVGGALTPHRVRLLERARGLSYQYSQKPNKVLIKKAVEFVAQSQGVNPDNLALNQNKAT